MCWPTSYYTWELDNARTYQALFCVPRKLIDDLHTTWCQHGYICPTQQWTQQNLTKWIVILHHEWLLNIHTRHFMETFIAQKMETLDLMEEFRKQSYQTIQMQKCIPYIYAYTHQYIHIIYIYKQAWIRRNASRLNRCLTNMTSRYISNKSFGAEASTHEACSLRTLNMYMHNAHTQ